MIRRHRGAPSAASSSSSSEGEEDAFSALERKSKRPKTGQAAALGGGGDQGTAKSDGATEQSQQQQQQFPVCITSSMKRHHGALSDARKAKMDELLSELAQEATTERKTTRRRTGGGDDSSSQPDQQIRGSFVQPGEELETTNVFIGNLATSITEAQLTELFSQFGELYSVKIMWARTAEERARNRHSGFVCFVHRQDAEEAMDACNETDPFFTGRRILMRWGKNVKKELTRDEGMASLQHNITTDGAAAASQQPDATASRLARRVQALYRNKEQGRFQSVQRTFTAAADDMPEHSTSRRQHPNQSVRGHQQLVLSADERDEFDRLFRHELCASRGAICRAMAFCFEKSRAWAQISDLLSHLLLESWGDDRDNDGGNHTYDDTITDHSTSVAIVETKIAQLYVLSDILFNSQQPGIRNAFRYRDTINQMAPRIFCHYGSASRSSSWLGRLTRLKVATAVSSVLGAWTNWSVYSPSFLDELHALFEGRSLDKKNMDDSDKIQIPTGDEENGGGGANADIPARSGSGGSGDSDADGEPLDDETDAKRVAAAVDSGGKLLDDAHGNHLDDSDNPDGEPLDSVDGDPLDDADGEPLDDSDADGEPLDDDDDGADGEPLDNADGDPLDDDERQQLAY